MSFDDDKKQATFDLHYHHHHCKDESSASSHSLPAVDTFASSSTLAPITSQPKHQATATSACNATPFVSTCMSAEAEAASAPSNPLARKNNETSASAIADDDNQHEDEHDDENENDDDEKLAFYFHCMESLTQTYGMDETTAHEALEHVMLQHHHHQQQGSSYSSSPTQEEMVVLAYHHICGSTSIDDEHSKTGLASTMDMNHDNHDHDGGTDPNEFEYYEPMEESAHPRQRLASKHQDEEEAYQSIASLDISANHDHYEDEETDEEEELDILQQHESMSCEDAANDIDDEEEEDNDEDGDDDEDDTNEDYRGARGVLVDISGSVPYCDDAVDDDDEEDHQHSQSNDRYDDVINDDDDNDDEPHDNRHTAPLHQDPPYPFERLPTSLKELAQFIESDRCRRIVILAGAGMSVASGIPDFRSSHNGLYATINPDLLSCTNAQQRHDIQCDPTVAFQQDLFLENPLPCLELLRTFILNTHGAQVIWKATLAHRFVELLAHKTNKLVRLYTQNIDGLEGQCPLLPREKVCHVHGTMDRAECARCGSIMDMGQFCQLVQSNIKDIFESDHSNEQDAASSATSDVAPAVSAAPSESSPIICPTCRYPSVKPAIVLFRAQLPMEFFEKLPQDIAQVDLLLILGTSLMVSPANSLVWRVPSNTLRVVINQHKVGQNLGIYYEPSDHSDSDDDDGNGDDDDDDDHQHPRVNCRDFFAHGDCEEVVLEIMTHLGWLPELQALSDKTLLPASSARLLHHKKTQTAAAR